MLLIIIPSNILVLLINATFPDIPATDIERRIMAAQRINNYYEVRRLYSSLISQKPLNIDYHYKYIQAHFSSWRFTSPMPPLIVNLLTEYSKLAEDHEPDKSDIGNYGMGLVHSLSEKYDDALPFFHKIRNKKMKYLNNSMGYVHAHREEFALAEYYLNKEIQLEGNLNGSYRNLINLYEKTRRDHELKALYRNKETRKYFPYAVELSMAIRSRSIPMYIRTLFRPLLELMTLPGVLAAVLVLSVWFIFLRNIDIFEPEKVSSLFIALGLGIAFSFGADLLYDLFDFGFGFDLTGSWCGDLAFCVFGIGFIEEFVKVVPFLLMVKFSRQVNESIDYIIYASIVALGFAFMENLTKFNEFGLHSIKGRAFTAVIMHMFLTSIVAYGIIIGKYKQKGKRFLFFLIGFLTACIIHGLYDFWIISKAFSPLLGILSLLMLFFAVVIFNHMINNALNVSEFFAHSRVRKLKNLRMRLGYSLAGILLFEYVVIALIAGPSLAKTLYASTFVFSWFLLLFICFSLTDFLIVPVLWRPLIGIRKVHHTHTAYPKNDSSSTEEPDTADSRENPRGQF